VRTTGCWPNDRREIQLCGQVQQEKHQMVCRQPLHRRGRQQQRLLRVPGTEGFGLAHGPSSRPDPLLSLRSGQIGGRLWRSGRWSYARQAPRGSSAGSCRMTTTTHPHKTWSDRGGHVTGARPPPAPPGQGAPRRCHGSVRSWELLGYQPACTGADGAEGWA
jgi:hypothetical protein